MDREEISQEYLRAILDYDPGTGIFTWRTRADMRRDWNARYAGKRAGTRHGAGYWSIIINNRPYLAHRLAWFYAHGQWPPAQLDHRNTIRGDDRIANLRPATSGENKCNRGPQPTNRCGYKGVSLHRATGLYRARITRHGVEVCLGYFHSAPEAAAAYAEATARYHGDFARTDHQTATKPLG